MLLKHRGDVTVEWVVTAAVVIVVIVAAIVGLLNQGGTQAGEMGNWVEGIGVPAIP
jgi:formate hydrogenlyase subunit 3/multisubunit Na+/H+ antiporter MnhD subunit